MERCMYFYMYVWLNEWTIGTTDERTDRWMRGKEERKKAWRKECILEMAGTLWYSSGTADLPFSFHARI